MMSNNDDRTQIISTHSSQKDTSNFDKQSLIGKKLSDRYLVEELIGQGGMSYIYRARDTFLEQSSSTDHPIVIKILREEFSQSLEAIKLLKEETAQTQKLSHPNIIKIFTANTEENTHYIVMEWVNGETLEHLIKRNKPTGLKFKNAQPIIKQLLNALSYAHSHGVIHNDLKPSNIIITASGELKILDFGIAKQLQNDDVYAFIKKSNNEAVSGYTPSYASPEQLNGYSANVTDDFFSLGCIIYEVLCSRHPYDRKASNTLPDNSKLKKPKNSPYLFWFTLKAALSLKAENRKNIPQKLSRTLSKDLKKTSILTLIAVIFTTSTFYVYNNINSEKSQIIAEKNNAIAMNNQVDIWMSWNAPKTLNNLNSIPPQFDTLKQGLLKIHQTEIIQIFDDKISRVQKIEDKLKNYPEIDNLYQQALSYYPDSKTLNEQYNNMQLERQSITLDIIGRLNNMLNQKRYFEKDQNNILNLIDRLKLIDNRNTYEPTQKQINDFESVLKKSSAGNSPIQLETLQNIKNKIFTTSQ
jgi:serine/threonine protein kinase